MTMILRYLKKVVVIMIRQQNQRSSLRKIISFSIKLEIPKRLLVNKREKINKLKGSTVIILAGIEARVITSLIIVIIMIISVLVVFQILVRKDLRIGDLSYCHLR